MPDYSSQFPFMLLDFFDGLDYLLMSAEELRHRSVTLGGFYFSRDLHVRYTVIGNTSGGNWNGDYRWLNLEKEGKNLNFTMFSVMEMEELIDDPIYGTRTPGMVLVVGRGNQSQQHATLQLDLTDLVAYTGEESVGIFHDGRLTASNTGSAKRKDVIDYMKVNAPYLVNADGLINLGSIWLRDDYSLNDSDIYEMLLRAAIYGYYRDCFREAMKSKRRLFHP